jgi:hypothetical protein
MFLHLVGSAGHIVHSGASGVRNIDTLFFMLGWARCSFNKKCNGTRYTKLVFPSGGICMSLGAFRCVRGVKRQRTIFHNRVGPVLIPQKLCRDTFCRTCVSVSSGIYGSRSAFRSVRAMKHRHNIFHARVGPVRFLQKAR